MDEYLNTDGSAVPTTSLRRISVDEIPFTSREPSLEPIQNFISQIEPDYRGLGIPTLYGALSIIANKSVLFISPRGTGKTRIINLTPDIPGTEVQKWDTFTYGELSNYCGMLRRGGIVRDKHLVFKVEEFSTFSSYHREQFLTTASKLISEGSFSHTTRSIQIDISNCKLTMLVAIQPSIYTDLCTKYTEWDSLSYDRFTKFVLINPLRDGTSRVPLNPILPENMTSDVALDISTLDIRCLIELFEGHVSRGRAEIFVTDYLKALAQFMGDKRVEQGHVELFNRLFYPYLYSFSRLQIAEDLDSPIVVKSSLLKLLSEVGSNLDYSSKEDLAREFKVTERQIERSARELLDFGLIEKPSIHAARYRLSPPFQTFFERYRDGSLFLVSRTEVR